MNTDVKKWLEEDGVKFLREIGVRKGQTVLDFGCGDGHYTIPASKVVGKNGKLYALDGDKDALDKLKDIIGQYNIENIELINENSRIPLKEDSINVVLCYDVIHYQNSKERQKIYKEIYKILKKRGLFSIYPKHHKEDYPLRELANLELKEVIEEIKEVGFILEHKVSKRLLHDQYYNEGYILNFRR